MKRILIILAAFLMASCAGTKQAVVIPSPTPEMLIVRPTREIQTAVVPEVVLTLTAMPTMTPTVKCLNIIGNINEGKRIYHCPGWRDYNKISFNAAEGDRYFCTEAEAIAAGFREPDYSHGACR